jgi:hypothetical protein
MSCCRSAGYPGDQVKGAGQEGIVESVWVLMVPLWGTPRGGCYGAMCDQDFGASMGALLPPRAGGKREREYGERSRKTPQIEREAK